MRIVIAPDGFKGCLPSPEVCAALREGLERADPSLEIVTAPIADGGDGTAAVLVEATGGRLVTERVSGPLGRPVMAHFGILGDACTAVIETASASGLALVEEKRRNPLLTSTYGTGQLVVAALDRGCREFIIGVGGSATTDGGAGLAQALGVRFYDDEGREITRATGRTLERIAHIDISNLDNRLADSRFRVACDVSNPLFGAQGAAPIYGPQKGATPEMVEKLDRGLRHLAEVVEHQLGKSVANLPGAGAAGGLAAGLVVFCDATLEPGAQLILETIGLREKATGADLLVTGEGRLDAQTSFGKGPWAVAQLGREIGVPVLAIAGAVDGDPAEFATWGLSAAWSISPGPQTLAKALEPEAARDQLRQAGYNLGQTLKLGCPLVSGSAQPGSVS
ncbi:MAG TPA: glycerate kinase [Armatimonadota bacterium]